MKRVLLASLFLCGVVCPSSWSADPPEETEPPAAVPEKKAGFGCQFGLLAALTTVGLIAGGLAVHFRTWEEPGVAVSERDATLLEKRLSDYRAPADLETDLKTLAPHLIRILEKDTHPNEGVSSADILLGGFLDTRAWKGSPQLSPSYRKWRDLAPQYGVLLPTADQIETTRKKYGLQPEDPSAFARAARDFGSFAESKKGRLEDFLAGYLSDVLWTFRENAAAMPEGYTLRKSLVFIVRDPSQERPSVRDLRVREVEEGLKSLLPENSPPPKK